jgi:hypothetical protein
MIWAKFSYMDIAKNYLIFPTSKVCSTTSSPPNAIPTSSGPNALG